MIALFYVIQYLNPEPHLNQTGNTMGDKILHTTDAEFDNDVLGATTPVLVDFWAEWCGPCKMITPILDELADQYAGKIAICKLDVDSNRETAMKYNVRGIPTLMLFNNGAMVDSKVGALSKAQLTEFIDASI